MDIKPIETFYNGYRFRSRLEARWAVFFDEMGIKYLYEHEGYEKRFEGEPDATIRYLPDFYFPDWKMHGEVKGVDCRGQIQREDAEKMSWMIDYKGPCANGIVMFGNIPNPQGAYEMEWAVWEYDRKGIRWKYVIGDNPVTGYPDYDLGLESAPCCFNKNDDYILTDVIRMNPYEEDKKLVSALNAARQARFEYGETPI